MKNQTTGWIPERQPSSGTTRGGQTHQVVEIWLAETPNDILDRGFRQKVYGNCFVVVFEDRMNFLPDCRQLNAGPDLTFHKSASGKLDLIHVAPVSRWSVSKGTLNSDVSKIWLHSTARGGAIAHDPIAISIKLKTRELDRALMDVPLACSQRTGATHQGMQVVQVPMLHDMNYRQESRTPIA